MTVATATTPVVPARTAVRHPLTGVLVTATRVVGWALGVAGLALVLACVLVPRLAGASPYTVLTGSMRPGIDPGDLVVVRPVTDVGRVGVGTVVTYQLHSGRPETVTHRVMAVSYDGDGRAWFTTRGDANPSPDPAPVRAEQLRGTLWYSVPQAGRLALVLDQHRRDLLRYGFGAGLVLYAGSLLVRRAVR